MKHSTFERAQRLPAKVAEGLGAYLGGAREPGLDAYHRETRNHDGDERAADNGHGPPRARRIELGSSSDIRGMVRHVVGRLPARGVASVGNIRPRWPKATMPLPDEARDLLAEYVRRQSIEHLLSLGMTARGAGEMACGLRKSQASAVVKELEEAGGATQWFRSEAAQLLGRGVLPRGWETKPDSESTAFWMGFLGRDGMAELDRWVYGNGYKCNMDGHGYVKATKDLDWWIKESLDYLVHSGHIKELFP